MAQSASIDAARASQGVKRVLVSTDDLAIRAAALEAAFQVCLTMLERLDGGALELASESEAAGWGGGPEPAPENP